MCEREGETSRKELRDKLRVLSHVMGKRAGSMGRATFLRRRIVSAYGSWVGCIMATNGRPQSLADLLM